MRRKTFETLLLLLCFAPMLAYAWKGTQARPYTDDLCYIHDSNALSVWEHIEIRRTSESEGRALRGGFSHIPLYHLLDPLDVHVNAVAPTLNMAAWLAAAAALLARLLALLGLTARRKTTSIAVAALLVGAATSGFYTWKSLHWYSAIMKYGPPLVQLTLYCWVLLEIATRSMDRKRRLAAAVGGAALCFAAGGSSESFVVVQLLALSTLLALAALVSSTWRDRVLTPLAAGWAATVAASLALLSSPALFDRAGAAIRLDRLAELLPPSVEAWLEKTSDPSLLPGFALMLAAGILVGLALLSPLTRAKQRNTSVNPLRIALLIQALLLPLLLNHKSFDPQILGRYSVEYTIIIALNVVVIGFFALLSRRASLERIQEISWLPQAGLASALLIVVLLTTRGMQWQAYLFLWLTLHSLLAAVACLLSPKMPESVARRFAFGIVILYAVNWLGTLGVCVVSSFDTQKYQARLFSFVPFLVAWSGLAWGIFIGWCYKSRGGSLRSLRIGALLLVIALCAGITAAALSADRPSSAIAKTFDERHALILAARATGEREIKIPYHPDLDRLHHNRSTCINDYYDIDSLTNTNQE